VCGIPHTECAGYKGRSPSVPGSAWDRTALQAPPAMLAVRVISAPACGG
jgi:hypothetical protein